MRTLAPGRSGPAGIEARSVILEKGIPMKRLLAFALITAIGMFAVGCGTQPTQPKSKPSGAGFGTSGDKTKTPAPPDKKP